MSGLLARRFGQLLAVAALVNLVGAQILHEAGHWLVATLTGRSPVWGLTALIQLSDGTPVDPAGWSQLTSSAGEVTWVHMASLPTADAEWAVMLAAGPLLQVLAVGAGLWVAIRTTRPAVRTLGLMFALVNGLSHGLYQIISSIRGGGSDETLLGEYTGLPWWLFAAIFGLAAVAGFAVAVSMLPGGVARRHWISAVVLGSLATGPLFMRLQSMMIDGVNQGGRFFTPVIGFSLPVLLLALAGWLGIWITVRRWPITDVV